MISISRMYYSRGYRKRTGRKRRYSRRYRKNGKYGRGNRKILNKGGLSSVNTVKAVRSSVPRSLRTKMYFTSHYIARTAPNQDFVFRGAGVYDPQLATGGQTCPYFNPLSQIYASYLCVASKITVTLISTGPGANTTTSGVCTIVPRDLPDAISGNAMLYADTPMARYVAVGPAGGNTTAVVSNYCTYKAALGKAPGYKQASDDTSWALTETVPSNDFYWHVLWSSVDGNTPNYIQLYVKITYYTTFFNPRDLVGNEVTAAEPEQGEFDPIGSDIED